MAILGNSDIIVLPNNVNPNTHIDYTELLGSQTQLLAVNENASHLWVFNTSSHLWEKINFLTENIGDGIEIYNDENTDDSYREVRTFNPGDKSIRIHQRDDVLDFRFGGHSFNTFGDNNILFNQVYYGYNDNNHLNFNELDRIKIISVDTVKQTFTISQPINLQRDFNPLKNGAKWGMYRRDSSPGIVRWFIEKYNNGVFYYSKATGSTIHPSVGMEVELLNPKINYSNINSNDNYLLPSQYLPGNLYQGYSIETVQTIFYKYDYLNKIHHLLVSITCLNGILKENYLVHFSSSDIITWNEVSIIDHMTNQFYIKGIIKDFENNFKDKIIIFIYGSFSYVLILNKDFSINSTIIVNNLSLNYSPVSNLFYYKGKLYIINKYNTQNNTVIREAINVNINTLFTTNTNNISDEIELEIDNNSYIAEAGYVTNHSIINKNNFNIIFNGFLSTSYKLLRNFNTLSTSLINNKNSKIVIDKKGPHIINMVGYTNINSVYAYQKNSSNNYFFITNIKNKKYLFKTFTDINFKGTLYLLELKDKTKTTIKKEVKDYIKFENSENILTYNQGNQIIVELWNNTTVNLSKIKDWIGEDFVILNSAGYTITINPSNGETIDGNNSISTTDAKIILKSIGNNKIIKYNK